MFIELQQAYKSYQAVITTNDEKIYIDNDSTISKNKSQISNENISNKLYTHDESSEEVADNNVVKERRYIKCTTSG